MVKHVLPWTVLVLAGCQGAAGRAPTRAEFDPAGAQARPAQEIPIPQNKEAEEILARDEKAHQAGLPIQPGDDLRFTVLGQHELTFDAKVPRDGEIRYPLIGKVVLAGRPPEEVRLEIKTRLEKDYLVAADVTVHVKEYARRRVYVLGAVARPLDGDMPGGQCVTLLQAIAQAGGFREDAAKHGVVIYRMRDARTTARVAIPFSVSALEGGRGRDPLLMPDDIVLVPSREKVYVLGQVARPGAFVSEADHGLTASQAISLAGGYTRVANDAAVRLLRRDKSGARKAYLLNLTRVVEGRPEEDVPLQPGDLLYVPESVF